MPNDIILDTSLNLSSASVARVDAKLRGLQSRINPINLSINSRKFTEPLGRISSSVDEFNKSLDASNARVIAFGASVGIIYSIQRAFKELLVTVVDVEQRIADIQVVFNLPTQKLEEFKKGLFDVAKNTGQSFAVVSEAATEFSRQGLSAVETLKRTEQALILTRLSGLDAAKSVETVTAAINTFKNEALDATTIVNKFAAVDAAFAVSSADLAQAIQRSAAAAEGAKISFDQLLSATTAIQERTARGGNVIGNSLKSIFTRLQRSRVREVIEGLGVATTETNGSLRNGIDILRDYANIYDTLSDQTRAYTDEQIAGLFQINNLKALVSDLKNEFSSYNGALEKSISATDEAQKRNAELNKTIQSLGTILLNQIRELFSKIGESGLGDLLKTITKAAIGLFGVLSENAGLITSTLGPLILGVGSSLAINILYKTVTFIKQIVTSFSIYGKRQVQVRNVQQQINNLLAENPALYSKIIQLEGNVLAQSRLISSELEKQLLVRQRMSNLTLGIAGSVAGRRVAGGGRVGGGSNFAAGRNPLVEELIAIEAGVGGARNSAMPKIIKDFNYSKNKKGTAVVNTDEYIVKNYKGTGADAVFNRDMIRKMGFPIGAKKVNFGFGNMSNIVENMAGGFLNSNDVERIIEKEKVGQTLTKGEISKLNNSVSTNGNFYKNLPTNTRQALSRINNNYSEKFRQNLPFGPTGGENRPVKGGFNPLVSGETRRSEARGILLKRKRAKDKKDRGEQIRRSTRTKVLGNIGITRLGTRTSGDEQISRSRERLSGGGFNNFSQRSDENFKNYNVKRATGRIESNLGKFDPNSESISNILKGNISLEDESKLKADPKFLRELTGRTQSLKNTQEERSLNASSLSTVKLQRKLKQAEIDDFNESKAFGKKITNVAEIKNKENIKDLNALQEKEISLKKEGNKLLSVERRQRESLNRSIPKTQKLLSQGFIKRNVKKGAGAVSNFVTGRNLNEDQKTRRAGKIFGGSLLLSVGAGFLADKVENESVSGGLSGFAAGASFGSLLGPIGTVVGGAIGALAGSGVAGGAIDVISDGFFGTTKGEDKKSDEELDQFNQKASEELKTREQDFNASREYLKTIEQYNRAIENGDAGKAKKLMNEANSFLSTISNEKLVDGLKKSGKNLEDLSESISSFQKVSQKKSISLDLVNQINGFNEGDTTGSKSGIDAFIKSINGSLSTLTAGSNLDALKDSIDRSFDSENVIDSLSGVFYELTGGNSETTVELTNKVNDIFRNEGPEAAARLAKEIVESISSSIDGIKFSNESIEIESEIAKKIAKFRKRTEDFLDDSFRFFTNKIRRSELNDQISSFGEEQQRSFRVSSGSLTSEQSNIINLENKKSQVGKNLNSDVRDELIKFVEVKANESEIGGRGKIFAENITRGLVDGDISGVEELKKAIEESDFNKEFDTRELQDKINELIIGSEKNFKQYSIEIQRALKEQTIQQVRSLSSNSDEELNNSFSGLFDSTERKSGVNDLDAARNQFEALRDVGSKYGVSLLDEEDVATEARLTKENGLEELSNAFFNSQLPEGGTDRGEEQRRKEKARRELLVKRASLTDEEVDSGVIINDSGEREIIKNKSRARVKRNASRSRLARESGRVNDDSLVGSLKFYNKVREGISGIDTNILQAQPEDAAVDDGGFQNQYGIEEKTREELQNDSSKLGSGELQNQLVENSKKFQSDLLETDNEAELFTKLQDNLAEYEKILGETLVPTDLFEQVQKEIGKGKDFKESVSIVEQRQRSNVFDQLENVDPNNIEFTDAEKELQRKRRGAVDETKNELILDEIENAFNSLPGILQQAFLDLNAIVSIEDFTIDVNVPDELKADALAIVIKAEIERQMNTFTDQRGNNLPDDGLNSPPAG